MAPRDERGWESKAVFNPAAAERDGKVHLLYRAIGHDDLSVLGYASSENGTDIDERSDEPAYTSSSAPARHEGPAIAYCSGGGGNGGCEDPRLTFIDDDAYLLYTAFDGWGSVRIALASITADDLVNKRWNWRPRVLISPPGEVHKNWVLFPEKINGKFAVLHSISPKVRIAYFDDLRDIKDKDLPIKSRYQRSGRRRSWDNWVRGAGPPPIRTRSGWLLLYHAMDERDPDRYKLGAMLLDLKDPTKIIARSAQPILAPDECYENDGWKRGVVYCCGAVVKDGRLIVYYGGADTVICAAETPLDQFVAKLKKGRTGRLVRGKRSPAKKRKRHATR